MTNEQIRFQHRFDAWNTQLLLPGVQARQFEYHKTYPNIMAIGSVNGTAIVANHRTNRVVNYFDDHMVRRPALRPNPVLGLCWLNTQPDKFLIGHAQGEITVASIDWPNENESLPAKATSLGKEFANLTSIHLNSTDQFMVVSGYSTDVQILDAERGSPVRTYKDVHEMHVNISRFANKTPYLFATSSFDRTTKVWDLRANVTKPNYVCRSEQANVMINFSPDDMYILSSAVDNEVRQYTTLDGRLNRLYDIQKYGSQTNFTRGYYMKDGDMVMIGSSDENVLRIFCTHTGDLLKTTRLYAGRPDDTLYIQSFRPDPHRRSSMSVIVNHRYVKP